MALPSFYSITGLPIPDWEMVIDAENITRIRTVKEEDLESIAKVLEIWTKAYQLFPERLSESSVLVDWCLKCRRRGRILVAEDAKGVAQVFARVMRNKYEFVVEELFTAPWSNASLRSHFEKLGSQKTWALGSVELHDLAAIHKVSVEELTTPHKGMGTIMMYALCHFVKASKGDSIELTSNEESVGFYRKVGMEERSPARRLFRFNLAHGVPAPLEVKVSGYFLKHAA